MGSTRRSPDNGFKNRSWTLDRFWGSKSVLTWNRNGEALPMKPSVGGDFDWDLPLHGGEHFVWIVPGRNSVPRSPDFSADGSISPPNVDPSSSRPSSTQAIEGSLNMLLGRDLYSRSASSIAFDMDRTSRISSSLESPVPSGDNSNTSPGPDPRPSGPVLAIVCGAFFLFPLILNGWLVFIFSTGGWLELSGVANVRALALILAKWTAKLNPTHASIAWTKPAGKGRSRPAGFKWGYKAGFGIKYENST